MAGRSVRAFAAAAVVLGVLAPAADAGHAPALAGETVITATRTAKMRVYVPQRARISVNTAKSVDVDGSGRMAGVLLRENVTRAPDQATFLRLPAQFGSRVYASAPSAPVTGCDRSLEPAHTDCSKAKAPTHYDLRRGTYTLYVVTDGAPVRVTLRFDNLRGRTELTPTTPAAGGFSNLKTSVDAPVSWSAGTEVRTTGPGWLFTAGWWQQDESAVGQSGACWYDGPSQVAPLGDYRWLPGCPAGSSGSGTEIRNPMYGGVSQARGGQHATLGTSRTDGAGTYGLGLWTTAQNVRATGGFAYWLDR